MRNYSHMTVAQIAATVISLCIYPYIIRRLGPEAYGTYIFALSITNYFIELIAFGIKFPAVKAIVEHIHDPQATNRIVTTIYTLKTLLALLSTLILITLILTIPPLRTHTALLLITFTTIITETLMPQWYYQGRQQMQYITYTTVACRLLSIPLIIALIHRPADIHTYAAISAGTTILSAILCTAHMMHRYHIRPVPITITDIRTLITDALPFLSSNIIGALKTETTTILIGTLLGMRDVALYDLANKIVAIPRLFIQNINQALFPDIVAHPHRDIRRIIRIEYLIGTLAILLITLVAYPTVLILGGADMTPAVVPLIILSISVLTWLVAGAYIAFVFIPAHRYYLVTRNQLVALLTLLAIALPVALIHPHLYTLTAAIALSGIAELIYCTLATRRHHLL